MNTPPPIADPVPRDAAGAREIEFFVPEHYNASAILFDNLSAGRSERIAVTGPAGSRTYAELAADACRFGTAFLSLGARRGDRVLLFLDDTPAYPAALFGAMRAGLVPLLINTLTPPDLLQFYLSDSGARIAVADAAFADRFDATACRDTQLATLVVVNGDAAIHAGSACTIRRPMAFATRARARCGRHPSRRHGVLDVLVRLHRPAQGHRASAARYGLHALVLRPSSAAS